RFEAATAEELRLEGEAEQARQAQLTCAALELLDDRASDAQAQVVVAHEERAHLAEVLPEHVQGTASDQLAVRLGDDELLHGAVEHREVLAGRMRRSTSGSSRAWMPTMSALRAARTMNSLTVPA